MNIASYNTLGIWCLIMVSCAFAAITMQAQEFSEMDEKILSILDQPKEQQQWDHMLQSIRTIIQEIKNMMKLMKENDQYTIQKAFEIYQLGKPKFIDHSISEPEIVDAAHVTKDQLQIFHELRDDIDNLWNDFLDILSEKTGETLDYGVHGQAPPGYEGEHGYGGYGDNGGYGGDGGGYGGGYGRGGGGRYGGGGYGRGRGGRRGGYGGGYGGGFGPPYH